MPEPVFTETLQVAVVVRDLDAAVRKWADEYGIGPWLIYEFNPETVERMVRDDQPAEYAMRLAVANVGTVMWELIQPRDDRSIYAEFLASHGEGLHHVAFGVKDYGQAMSVLRGKGHKVVQGGTWNGMTYTYLSTEKDLGFVSEIYDWPADFEQPTPDAVYPPDAT